ncbi:hypothetical protein D9M72_315790 [compost metagenome]
MEIRLQSRTDWLEIYRPHGWKCRLGRDEHLGKMVRRRNGIREFPFFRRQADQYRIFRFDE